VQIKHKKQTNSNG